VSDGLSWALTWWIAMRARDDRLAFDHPSERAVQCSDGREIFLESRVDTVAVSGGEDIE
jgi:hypothetical protein